MVPSFCLKPPWLSCMIWLFLSCLSRLVLMHPSRILYMLFWSAIGLYLAGSCLVIMWASVSYLGKGTLMSSLRFHGT